MTILVVKDVTSTQIEKNKQLAELARIARWAFEKADSAPGVAFPNYHRITAVAQMMDTEFWNYITLVVVSKAFTQDRRKLADEIASRPGQPALLFPAAGYVDIDLGDILFFFPA